MIKLLRLIKKERRKVQQQSFDVRFMQNNLRENTKVTGIECIEKRQCYDSTWLIRYQNNGADRVVKIVRYDDETTEGLCYALDNLSVFTKDKIMSLDKKLSIYYD